MPSIGRAPLGLSSHPTITYSSSLAASAGALLSAWHLLLLPENWGHVLVGVKPKKKKTKKTKQKDSMKPKIRRKDLLLVSSEENTVDLSQSSVSPAENPGPFKLK